MGAAADSSAELLSTADLPAASTDEGEANQHHLKAMRVLLLSLLGGTQVKLGDNTYRLFMKGDYVDFPTASGELEHDALLVKLTKNPGTPEESVVWGGTDATLSWLLGEARKLTVDEISIIAANNTLGRERRRNSLNRP